MSGLKHFGVAVAMGAVGVNLLARALRSQRKMDFAGKTVLISGGSRGLGLEMARLFAREGASLALLARDGEELKRAKEDLAGLSRDVVTRVCDVRDREAVHGAVESVLAEKGRIDVLVNCAGIIQVGPAEHMSLADYKNAMAVHAWGPLYLMEKIAPVMKRQGGGRVVNISSIGGKVAVPHLAPYCVSKYALAGLSDEMRAELAKDNIYVTTVCPGLMRTGSHINALFKGQHKKEFTWFAVSASLPVSSINAADAARQIVEACRYGDPRLIITIQAKLLHLMDALMPGLTASFQKAAARALPSETGSEGDRIQKGYESETPLAPSVLTRLSDEAAARNNELPDEARNL